MPVQARFYVAQIVKSAYAGTSGGGEVKLQAVSRGDQNAAWAAATPSGTVSMHVNNPEAAKWFEDRLGTDVAITFEEAAIRTPDDGHPFRPANVPAHHYLHGMCGECAGAQKAHTA
jgi:hypothetical protein